MSEANRTEPRTSTIYSAKDYETIQAQIRKRWRIVALPCIVLLAVLIWSLTARIEWVTTGCTILIGVILIAAYDLAIKPLDCYRRHLRNVLYSRVHEATLPFVALSEDISMVEGVACRALTCLDYDAKGRPYDRLFYFDCLKQFPEAAEGDMLRVIHHDLVVADVTLA